MNRQALKLKGNVESTQQFAYEFSINNGKIIKGAKMNFSSLYYSKQYDKALYFNKKGNLIKKLIFTPKKDTFSTTLYNYNSKGELILEKVIDSLGLTINRRDYLYGKTGRVKKVSIFDYQKLNLMLKYLLYSFLEETNSDKIGKELKNKIRNTKEQDKINVIFNYLTSQMNSKNDTTSKKYKLTKKDWDSLFGELLSAQNKSVILYSRQFVKNDTIDMVEHKKVLHFKEKDTTQTKAIAYYKKGKVVKARFFYSKDNGEKLTFQYNSKGQLLEKSWMDYSSNYLTVWKFTYNQHGDVSQTEKYGYNFNRKEKNTTLERIEYQYDKKGNWTRKAIFVKSIPFLMIQRRITYF